MGSSKRTISQQAFEAMVAENMEDLDMDADEALEDTLQTLTLQGVDLSGIVKCVPGVTSAKDDPVVQLLDGLRTNFLSKLEGRKAGAHDEIADLEEMAGMLDKLYDLCSVEGSDNAAIARKNGGVELLTSLCGLLYGRLERPLVTAFRVLSSILQDVQSTDTFGKSGGPKIVVDILKEGFQNATILDNGFSVIAAASTANEVLKESFMELKLDELLVKVLREQTRSCPQSLYDVIRILLTPDDNRVVASQVYGYARRFAKVGIADALVDALHDGLSSSSLVSACIALKAVAVNDEICRSITGSGGIDIILKCIDDCNETSNKAVSRACCSLLSKLGGSDENKGAIVQRGGLDILMKLCSRFSEDPSILQEVMSIITVLSLRSPVNAALAVEAGAGDLASQAMQRFPAVHQLQRQSCFMIRNLVARNPENRIILLSSGIEKLIRKAKGSHDSCRNAASAALRDLGLDDYNA
ncbi:hypothetical protein IEQ34_019288 [Dendrobium chrysotoxum]|uniref:LRRK2 ARM repeat domain-containing protein n=1 Tax=Dendrobium chrysotoxum TaxID=161865 RepID=A0AAV7G848_DENCH|nr:hypothetical protein IEQ34_019288 [Dendrobium chrysotoxum]